MFDDPKKDLKWLEQQLLAEEQPQQEASDEDLLRAADAFLLEEEDWLEEELQQARVLTGDAPRQQGQTDIFGFLEEDFAPDNSPAEEPPLRSMPQTGKKKKKKEKGVGGLVFLACLETVGIIAVLLWWLIWLL